MVIRLGVTGLKKTRVVCLLDLFEGRIPPTNPSQQSLSRIPLTNPFTTHTSTFSTHHSLQHFPRYSHHHLSHSSAKHQLHHYSHLQQRPEISSSTSTTTTSISEPITFPKQPPSKKKSSIKKSSGIAIPKGLSRTLDNFTFRDIRLKRHKKYSLPFRLPD